MHYRFGGKIKDKDYSGRAGTNSDTVTGGTFGGGELMARNIEPDYREKDFVHL